MIAKGLVVAFWLGLIFLGRTIWLLLKRKGTDVSTGDLLLGFWLPFTFFVWGMASILFGRSWLFDRMGRLFEVSGGAAAVVGVVWIAVGFCFHSSSYVIWRRDPVLSRYSDPTALGAAITALGGLAVLMWLLWW